MDEMGTLPGRGRLGVGLAGLARLHGLVADHAEDPLEVIVGIEIDRGLVVDSLVAAGYAVDGLNPLAVSRDRDRHTTSGAKSDAADAKLLADLVRTDHHNHRRLAGDSDEAGAIRVLARAHQGLVWMRQRQLNGLRSALRDYYPGALLAFGTELGSADALAILALGRAGRTRNLERRATRIQQALRTKQPATSEVVADAFGAAAVARVGVLVSPNAQIGVLERPLAEHFDAHPDAEILGGLAGLGPVLGASGADHQGIGP